jgi:hypothetical protein
MIELKFNANAIKKDFEFESLLKSKIQNNNSYEYKILYVYLLLGLYSYKNMMGDLDNFKLIYKQKKVLETSYVKTLSSNAINFETIKENLQTNFVNKNDILKYISKKI